MTPTCGICTKIHHKSTSVLTEILTARTELASEPSLIALMEAADGGSREAVDALFRALYSELHRLAKFELARHGAPMSLSATTLLHKAYV